MKLIIGNKNYSSWSLRPWLLLTHHKIDFEEIHIALDTPDMKAQVAPYTDVGLVPVLHDADLVVWDSLAICEYVSEHYLEHKGWPSCSKTRALARAATAEMHSGFGAIRSQLPMNCRATQRRVNGDEKLAKDIARIDQLFSQMRERYGDLGPWLFGEFSIADCFYAPVILRFRTYGVALSAKAQSYAEWQLQNPALQLWIKQAEQETAVIDHEEVGY